MSVPDHVRPVLDRAREAFGREFGGEPRWAASAPGRVNLIGEHTDYNGGFVLPIAIDRVCVAVAGPSRDAGLSRIFAADMGKTAVADLRRPLEVGSGASGQGIEQGSWSSYVFGVIAQFQRDQFQHKHDIPNLDIAIASSVPLGSGLSSSASLEVSIATLMELVLGERLDPLAKAKLCQRAEHEFAGVPCGIMDMLVSVSGQAGHAILIDCEADTLRGIPVPREAAWVVANSNVRHALAGGEYSKRRAACESAARKLGVASLRHAVTGQLDCGLTPEEARCARHVISENHRVERAAAALATCDLRELGTLMLASHASLRDDYEVSCPELDVLVETATGLPGVYGARMTGAGFGGCVVVLTELQSAGEVAAALSEVRTTPVASAPTAFVVTPSQGAMSLPA